MQPTLDDVWIDASEFDLPEHLVLARRQRYRIMVVLAMGGFYAIDTVFLSLFYLVGRVSLAVPVIYTLAGMLHVAVFFSLHRCGIAGRAKDPHLTVWHVVTGVAIQLSVLALAPQLTAYFMALIFVVFSFGALRLRIRTALLLWLATCCATALVLVPIGMVAYRVDSTAEALVVGLSFAFVLLRCLLLNYYGTMQRRRWKEQTASLAERMQVAREMATHDRLTGAFNRHAILPFLEDQIKLAGRKEIPCCVAMIDIDHFKSVNDRYGHLVGDVVLRQVVLAINACIRPTDKLARYGGEEFLLVMPSTSLTEGWDVVERLREEIAGFDWQAITPERRISISAGLTDIGPVDSVQSVILRADTCLYSAKNAGRNQSAWQSFEQSRIFHCVSPCLQEKLI